MSKFKLKRKPCYISYIIDKNDLNAYTGDYYDKTIKYMERNGLTLERNEITLKIGVKTIKVYIKV